VVNAGTSHSKNLPKDPPPSIENYTFEKHHKYPRGYLIYNRRNSPHRLTQGMYQINPLWLL